MELKTIRLSHIDAAKVIADVKKIVPDWNETLPITRRLAYDEGDYTTETITNPDSGETYTVKHYTREPELQLVPLIQGEGGWIDAHHKHESGARIDISNAGERVIADPESGNTIAAGEFRVDVTYPSVFERTPFKLICQCCPTNPDRQYSIPDQEVERITPDSTWLVVQIKGWMDIRGIAYLSADNKTTLLNKITTFLEGGINTERTYTNCYGTWVSQGEVIIHNGTRYLSGVGHYAHAGFNPSEIPWFTELPPIGVIPEWSSFNHWEFQSLPLGTAVMDNGVIYYLINQGHGYHQPSGAHGHFGWSTIQP
jgi:hypothetical protein